MSDYIKRADALAALDDVKCDDMVAKNALILLPAANIWKSTNRSLPNVGEAVLINLRIALINGEKCNRVIHAIYIGNRAFKPLCTMDDLDFTGTRKILWFMVSHWMALPPVPELDGDDDDE